MRTSSPSLLQQVWAHLIKTTINKQTNKQTNTKYFKVDASMCVPFLRYLCNLFELVSFTFEYNCSC